MTFMRAFAKVKYRWPIRRSEDIVGAYKFQDLQRIFAVRITIRQFSWSLDARNHFKRGLDGCTFKRAGSEWA
jgi:hypothetical protein